MKRIGLSLLLTFALWSNVHASLIGYWDFNEGLGDSAFDSSGNNNTASGLDASWVSGKHGYGTNSSNVIVQPDQSLLTASSLSISAWAKIDEFNGLQRRIVEMAPNYGFLFNPQNNDSQTAFLLSLNLQNYSFEYQDIPQGEWFHTAATWDGNVAQYYFNGIPATPVSAQTVINQDGTVPLYMGAEGYTLDEVRIYDNVLSQEEILRDMKFDSTNSVIPEPTTVLLFGAGLAGIWLRRRSV